MAERKVTFIIGSNIQNFTKGMKSVQKQFKQVGRNMQNVGKTLSASFTAPVVALGGVAVKAWETQAKAIAQVEAGLRSTGGSVGYTSDQLQKMASELQKNTLFGDEDILKNATSQLLTFTNIAGEQFARTQEAALDLSTRLDGDLKSASIQLGKALNDPVANLSALSRSGIQFNDQQTEMIKNLANSGRLMDAQNIILDELEKQYGGSAEAAAKADSGFTQLRNTLGDVAESFGEIITEAIRPFLKRMREVAERVNNLDTESKTKILRFAAAIAAIGPAITAVGLGFSALGVAIGALMSPITLVVGALAGLSVAITYIWDNWKAITERISNIGWWKNTIIEMIQFLAINNPFNGLVYSYNAFLMSIGQKPIQNPFINMAMGLEELKDDTVEYQHEFGTLKDALVNGLSEITGLDIGQLFSFNLQNIRATGAELQKVSGIIKDDFVPQLNITDKTVEVSTSNMKSNWKSFVDTATELGGNFKQFLAQEMSGAFLSFGDALGASLSGAENSMATTFEKITLIFLDFAKSLARLAAGIGGVMLFIPGMQAQGIALLAAATALQAIATGFSMGIDKRISNREARANNVQIPELASGGIAYGPTLAQVGEYAGAGSNPEVIAPLSNLKHLLGMGGGKTIHNHIHVMLDNREIASGVQIYNDQLNR